MQSAELRTTWYDHRSCPATTRILATIDCPAIQFANILNVPDHRTIDSRNQIEVHSPFGLVIADDNVVYFWCGSRTADLMIDQDDYRPQGEPHERRNLFILPKAFTLLRYGLTNFGLNPTVRRGLCKILTQGAYYEYRRLNKSRLSITRSNSGDIAEHHWYYSLLLARGRVVTFSSQDDSVYEMCLREVHFSEFVPGFILRCSMDSTSNYFMLKWSEDARIALSWQTDATNMQMELRAQVIRQA